MLPHDPIHVYHINVDSWYFLSILDHYDNKKRLPFKQRR
jgi:hypothetical protein